MISSEFSIVVPSLINISVRHINEYAITLGIRAFISIPFHLNGPFEYTPNVTYIRSPLSGQVAQRIFAVHHSRCTYILSMDDDIFISPPYLRDLFYKYTRLLSTYTNPVLGVQVKSSVQPISSFRHLSPFALNLISFIENTSVQLLKKPSTLSPLNFNSHHDSSYSDFNTPLNGCYQSDWFSGGFFISPCSIFPSSSYYPFPGKAFCEDVILSIILKRAGSPLFIANGITAFTESILPSYTFSNLRAKFYLLRFSNVRLRYIRMFLSLCVRQLSMIGII